MFGGYPWRYQMSLGNRDFEHYLDRYYDYWQRLLTRSALQDLMAPVWSRVQHVSTRDIFRGVFRDHHRETSRRPEHYINCSLYFEAKTFLHGLLVVEDKLSMAHGMETRVPFLDNDLVDFAMRIPVALKLGALEQPVRFDGGAAGQDQTLADRSAHGKVLLREAMRGRVPKEIVSREKQGFSAPDASWFRGESIRYVQDRLFRPHARIYDVFDRKIAQGLVGDHIEGRQNRRLLIWSLLYLESWFEHFMP
jgi:asparagine synthase (glutamine-hydrolysing)